MPLDWFVPGRVLLEEYGAAHGAGRSLFGPGPQTAAVEDVTAFCDLEDRFAGAFWRGSRFWERRGEDLEADGTVLFGGFAG